MAVAAAPRKYAGLPDLDEAPDIFETAEPELASDHGTSTLRTASRASSVDSSSASSPSADRAIVRQRLDQDAARARFLGARVDARAADFSDRILPGGPDQRSYVVRSSRHHTRRRRRRREGAKEGGGSEEEEEEEDGDRTEDDDEDEGTPEGLRRKLARLTREAAELRADMERLQAEDKKATGGREEGEDDAGRDVKRLDEELASLNKTIVAGQTSAQSRLARKLGTKLGSASAEDGSSSSSSTAAATSREENDGAPAYTIAYAPSYDSAHALARAAAFDSRLASLEAALGVERIPLPTKQDQDTTGAGPSPAYPKPVLPTLDLLDRQLVILASTTTGASLDTVGQRVAQLTRDAEKLTEARRKAKSAHEALAESWTRRVGADAGGVNGRINGADEDGNGNGNGAGVGNGGAGGLGLDDPETVTRINALHGALPTIEALAPMLPGTLDRLRSLRLIHQDAAGASKSLAELEKRQTEVDKEMAEWGESLKKVEDMLGKSEGEVKENMQVVESWVKELEGRLKGL